jgi:hypothetical protein
MQSPYHRLEAKVPGKLSKGVIEKDHFGLKEPGNAA